MCFSSLVPNFLKVTKFLFKGPLSRSLGKSLNNDMQRRNRADNCILYRVLIFLQHSAVTVVLPHEIIITETKVLFNDFSFLFFVILWERHYIDNDLEGPEIYFIANIETIFTLKSN